MIDQAIEQRLIREERFSFIDIKWLNHSSEKGTRYYLRRYSHDGRTKEARLPWFPCECTHVVHEGIGRQGRIVVKVVCMLRAAGHIQRIIMGRRVTATTPGIPSWSHVLTAQNMLRHANGKYSFPRSQHILLCFVYIKTHKCNTCMHNVHSRTFTVVSDVLHCNAFLLVWGAFKCELLEPPNLSDVRALFPPVRHSKWPRLFRMYMAPVDHHGTSLINGTFEELIRIAHKKIHEGSDKPLTFALTIYEERWLWKKIRNHWTTSAS